MTDRLGKYEVLEELGRGGMGVVYRGWDPQLGRSVAIKLIVGVDADPTFLQRFAREWREHSATDASRRVSLVLW